MNQIKERLVAAVNATAFEHRDNLIHLFAGGSALHGASLPGKTDLDVYGVFIEPKVNVFGLDKYEHFTTSTSGDERRNTSDDTDVTLYSLRRWAALAAKGNPTALQFMFADNALFSQHTSAFQAWEYAMYDFRHAVVSKAASTHYKGFVSDQMGRLLGTRGQGKHGQRPELTTQHGFDVKAAMHAVRLLGEGIELMRDEFIRFPRPNVEELRSIRRGEWSLDKLCSHVSILMAELDDAVVKSSLQERPNRVKVNTTLVDVYEQFYFES